VNVVEWAETHWLLPETGKPIVLQPWEKTVLLAMFPSDGSPSPWETFFVSTVKKAGKTTLNAIATLYATLTFPAPETAFCVANDLVQAQERVFDLIVKAVRVMGLERRGAVVISKNEIMFRETGSRIVAIPADFAGAAGATFGISSWTELWAFRFEDHIRLFEELTPVAGRRSIRIVDSYAGFAGDAPILEPMWNRALAGERLDDELPVYTNGRLWAFIDQGEEAQRRAWRGSLEEMEDYYLEQSETLRPGTFARLHRNQWQSGEEAFITAAEWDACVDPGLTPVAPHSDLRLRLSVGVDAAVKHDSAAVVAVAHDGQRLRLVGHRIWTPRRGESLDLEETIESFLLQLHAGYSLAAVLFDPFQMHRSALTLRACGLPMVELPQTPANLTSAGQNAFELIRGRNIVVYPDAELRRHALNAVAIDTGRGWRIAKERTTHKIDGLAALSFACLDAIGRSPGTGHASVGWSGDSMLEDAHAVGGYDRVW
jgi:phage terminase large subunit-like protein